MSDFIVPKGREYTFTVKILDKESFLPKDLATMSAMTVDFISNDVDPVSNPTGCKVDDTGNEISYTVVNALNGLVKVTVPAGFTNLLEGERGDKVDGYYLKPVYKCVITVKFSDDSDILSIIDKVYVQTVGC